MRQIDFILDFIDNGTVADSFTQELNSAVIEIREDKRWRKRLMTVEQLIKDEASLAYKKGKTEGLAEGRTEGRAEGLAEGIAEGRASGIALINQLHSLLINDGRMDDLKKSINDSEYQEKLIREYKLNEID